MRQLCGIIGMAVGAYQLSNSNGSIGLASMPRFVISGIYFFSLATTVTGLLFICTGSAGAVFFFSRWRTSPSGGKILDMVYHSLLFLVAILSMVLLGLTAYGTAMAAKGGMYDTEFWAELVRSNSGFLCDTEARLSCASFESRGQCVSLNNETVNTYCPGHFCIDFCRIAQDNVNIQPICESCRRDPLKSIPAFLDCRRHEKEVTRKQACQSFLPNDIQSAYQKILAAVILFILCVSISVSVSTYQYCLS